MCPSQAQIDTVIIPASSLSSIPSHLLTDLPFAFFLCSNCALPTDPFAPYESRARVLVFVRVCACVMYIAATSEVSVSVTLDPSKIWTRDLIQEELNVLEDSFGSLAKVGLHRRRSIISLIGDAERSSAILETASGAMRRLGVNPEMVSKGAFKNNIALIVPEEEGVRCTKALHEEFFS